ncbi:sensor histidine kinase [Vibrio mediterranei]|uniref:sensor histidine kinase n=1 Tax=Vibrio mediterranei TaxID=689 RepID=UPI002815999D|nr:ATP-binding protein [Vibrio mediterranei]
MEDALELFDNRREGVSIVFEQQPDCLVRANSIRLEQVLVNLVSNALDAVEGSAEPLLVVSIWSDTKTVSVSVQDNGKGIPADELPYLFDPFYSTKRSGKGLGLGLSIAYNIIQDFGGTIHVQSEIDQGTEFIVTLQQGNPS